MRESTVRPEVYPPQVGLLAFGAVARHQGSPAIALAGIEGQAGSLPDPFVLRYLATDLIEYRDNFRHISSMKICLLSRAFSVYNN